MKNIGVILTVGVTAVVLITIGMLNFLPVAGASQTDTVEAAPLEVVEPSAVRDITAVQAAYDAREALLTAQIAELDKEYADRQTAYEARVADLGALLDAGSSQLAQLQDQESGMLEQINQLQTAQAERAAAYESQRNEAYYQYQTNLQQLQVQLDEANAKLGEALAQLGQ